MKRLALKVDCDTYLGTRDGVPSLLRLFDRHKIRATFLFTLGPDRTGRAALRVFTRKGFLKKMLRSKAPSLYPLKTMLYGTLLPSPMIGKELTDVIRTAASAGHDVGVHSWDHVRWHDQLDRLPPEQIEHDYSRAHAMFESIFGFKARASGAAGWHATAASLAVQEKYRLLYTSDTRNGSPCFLEADGQKFNTLEIPSTLPTWDEMLGDPTLADETAFLNYFRALIKDTEVHSIHTEVEGTAKAALFERQLDGWKADGVQFLTLADVANEQLKNRSAVPRRRLTRTTIPNRGGEISSSI